MASENLRIIGLDPGLRTTGWGIIESEGNRLSYLAHGLVQPGQKLDLSERLSILYKEIDQIIAEWEPKEAAVEETFINTNARSTLKLGQARGVVMVVPAMKGLKVAEYAPNKVKKSIVGAGHADKDQIIKMVQYILPGCKEGLSSDAADALAIAICHAHYRQTNNRWEAA